MRELRVGMIGGGLMGKAHSLALAALPMYVWPPPLLATREMIAEATPALAEEARRRFGFERCTADWREVVADDRVDVVDVVVPSNLHREIVSAAISAGKHVICEKPLGMSVCDARELRDAAVAAGIVHQVGFNWRMAPSVQLAARLVHEGVVGEVRSFRGFWLADSGVDPASTENWRYHAAVAGSGAIGDLGSHVIDMARLLVGEFERVVGLSRTYPRPPGYGAVDVDDNTIFLAEFCGAGYGAIESTRLSPGRKNTCGFELYGSQGSLVFDWESMNELLVYDGTDPSDRQGFRRVLTGPDTPGAEHFWPVAGYQIGYLESKLLQLLDFVRAVDEGREAQTTFNDALRCSLVVDAVQKSVRTGEWTSPEVPAVRT